MKAGHTGQPPQCSVIDIFSIKHSLSHFSVISCIWYNSSHRLQMQSDLKKDLFSRLAGAIYSSFPLSSVRDGILLTSVWYLLIWNNAKETKLKILEKLFFDTETWCLSILYLSYGPWCLIFVYLWGVNKYIYMLIYCYRHTNIYMCLHTAI